MTDNLRGTLSEKEAHPSAFAALEWLRAQPVTSLIQWQSAFSSCAISGNRLAEVCSETLDRFMNGKPISDRYLLGLCWSMRYQDKEDLKDVSNPKVRRRKSKG